ncbi:MAG: proteasome subunit beta [Candidatus ainarchaeum sp.]|nr:proteasome subunit beta [Candidatus ainarchaeum sp.]
MNYFREVEGLPISLISERTRFNTESMVVNPNQQLEDKKTGTTTVGLIAKDVVILAADQRATMGHIAEKGVRKVYPITNHVALTISGAVGDSLALIRFLKAQANLYEIERSTKITPKAITSLLSNVLNGNRYYPFVFAPIIGGINSEPELFELTPFGCISEKKDYAVTGSGTTFAMTTLDKEYKKNMSEKEAIELAVRSVRAATNRDIYSGGENVTVAVIDKNGYREIDANEVEKIVKKIKFN